jgi:hypothetical protein
MLKIALLLSIISLAACDFKSLSGNIFSDAESPDLYIMAGTKLLIADNLAGGVFGYDNCPQLSLGGKNCVKLADKEEVEVIIVLHGQEAIREVWSVIYKDKRTSLVRPNGWMVREPTNI